MCMAGGSNKPGRGTRKPQVQPTGVVGGLWSQKEHAPYSRHGNVIRRWGYLATRSRDV